MISKGSSRSHNIDEPEVNTTENSRIIEENPKTRQNVEDNKRKTEQSILYENEKHGGNKKTWKTIGKNKNSNKKCRGGVRILECGD